MVTRAPYRRAMHTTYGAIRESCSEKSTGKRMCLKLGITFSPFDEYTCRHVARRILVAVQIGSTAAQEHTGEVDPQSPIPGFIQTALGDPSWGISPRSKRRHRWVAAKTGR